MGKKELTLMEQVAQRTRENVVKGRGVSSKTTYLDRFVDILTDEDGNPTEPKTRTEIIAEMSFQFVTEKTEGREEPFTLGDGTTEDDLMLAEINKKCKAQVASAIANNQNSTSISYNEKYKDVWEVVKHDNGGISLKRKGE